MNKTKNKWTIGMSGYDGKRFLWMKFKEIKWGHCHKKKECKMNKTN